MVTSVSTQLLPTLRSNVRLLRGRRRSRPTLRGLDAHPESELETKLVRGGIPGRDRDSSQMKRIGSRGVDAAEARAATAEPGGLHEISIRFGEVIASPIRIGKEVNGGTELSLELEPRAENLLPRFAVRDLAEIDVGSRMRADVEALPVERSNLIPGHPGMTNALLTVPPRHDVRPDPPGDDKEGSRQRELLEHGNRIFKIVSVAVIERDGEVTLHPATALQPVHEVSQ